MYVGAFTEYKILAHSVDCLNNHLFSMHRGESQSDSRRSGRVVIHKPGMYTYKRYTAYRT